MKHFIVEVNYKVPVEELGETLPEHRKFLGIGYERGLFLLSGPRVPRTGGMLVARAESLEELQSFLSGDPYLLKDLAEHRYIEFDPVLRQGFLEDWVSGG